MAETPELAAARRRIEQLKPQWLAARGRMRRHFASSLVDECLGDGRREVILKHAGLELVECLTIEDCDLNSVVACACDPAPELLKARYRELPAHERPRFRPPGDNRKLRHALLDFLRQHFDDPFAAGCAPWFTIKELKGDASAGPSLR